MALITAATEENSPTHGFSEGATLTPLPLTPGMRLDHAVRALAGFAFGDTDCALPMLHALKHDLAVDAFVAYTDSDTRAGTIHPRRPLRVPQPDRHCGEARGGAIASSGFSIADPNNGGILDVVRFDAAAPG